MRTRDDFRDWHYLRRLKTTTTPASILIFDTETYPIADANIPGKEWHHLRLWVAEYLRIEGGKETRNEVVSGASADEFWQYVKTKLDKKRPLWMFAHNLGFDLTVLGFWKDVLESKWEFKQTLPKRTSSKGNACAEHWYGCSVLNDPPTIVKCREPGTTKTIIAVDTYNYFRSSLAELGESIGVQKSQKPSNDAPLIVWADYCYQDCQVLKHAVMSLINFVKDNDLGTFGLTVSAQAMFAYRSRFIEDNCQILIHGNKRAINLERQSFHGGAVHCWFKGKVVKEDEYDSLPLSLHDEKPYRLGPVHYLDVQSFYPSIMHSEPLPYKLKRMYDNPSEGEFNEALESKGVIADVTLDCDEPGFPVTRAMRTYYATGRLRTVLPYPELARAVSEKCIVKINAMATYEVGFIFRRFVYYFWQLRKEYEKNGNLPMAYMCKLMLNSLYGKFGMKKYRWEDAKNHPSPVPFGYFFERGERDKETQVFRSMCWLPQKQCSSVCETFECNGIHCANPGDCGKPPLEYEDSFPAIPSYVTSHGRERILVYRAKALRKNCYYSDTDSIHTNDVGLYRLQNAGLVSSGELGYLRLVESAYSAEYRGYKDYTFNGVDTIAGMKKDATNKTPDSYEQLQFQRLHSILRGEQLNSVAVQRVIVPKPRPELLGEVDASGIVSPPRLIEW